MSANNEPSVANGRAIPVEREPNEPLMVNGFTNSTVDPTDRIGHLPTAQGGVESVQMDAEVSVAATKMMALDYSQLGVTNGPKNLRGMVSWRTIARALLLTDSATKVRDCIENPQTVDEDESLLKAIPVIAEHDYVLVKAHNGLISGIVTAADLSLKFRALTEPFLLLREIERHLRKILDGRLSPDEIQGTSNPGVIRRRINGLQDLTLGECIGLFGRPENWCRLGLRNIDRSEFIGPLLKINEIRNRVMHFRGDSPLDGETKLLRNFAGMVRLIDQARGNAP
jgi:hypothetical protein